MKTKNFPKPALFGFILFFLQGRSRVQRLLPQISDPGMRCVTGEPGAERGQGPSQVFQGLFICFEEESFAGCGFCNKGERGKHPDGGGKQRQR